MRCESCKIDVLGENKRCPLCHAQLKGAKIRDGAFPQPPPVPRHMRFYLSLAAFFTITFAAVCIAINISATPGRFWSLFVIAGLCSLWVAFANAYYRRGNIPKLILWQVTIIVIIAVLWDLFTGFRRWSIDFVLPIICTAAMVTMFVIAQVRKLDARDYIIYLFMVIAVGFVSLILLAVGALTVALPSVICFTASIIFLAALFLFQGRTMLSEIRRRMHL